MTDQPTPGSREEAAMRREMGKGPFAVGKDGLWSRDLLHPVLDAGGRAFCYVAANDCIGQDIAAAKARAARIAEALNVQEGHSKPVPYIDGDGNLRAPAGYGFVAKGERCEMVPLVNVTVVGAG